MKTFQNYDSEHPEIYELFKKIAEEYIRQGYQKLSAKFIMEQIRWHYHLKTNEYFKVSNNYTSMYARKFLNEHPKYAGFFSLKPLKTLDLALENAENY